IRTGATVIGIDTTSTGRALPTPGARARVEGVTFRTDDGIERIDADVVVGAMDLHHLETRLLPEHLQTYPESWWKRRDPGPGAVLAYLGADGWFRESQLRQAVAAAMARVGTPAVPVEATIAPASVPPPPPSLGGSGPREVLRGQADAVPLGEVLQVLQMQMQSGQVQIHRGEGEEVSIHLRHGLVDLVTARGAADEFRMGRYLLEEGILDRDALGQGLEGSRASGRRLGDELIARGLITRDQLEAALTRQSSELIYEVLRWTGARYVFVRGAASGGDMELGLPVASLVMEGFRRVDEWRLIEEQISPATVLMRDEASIDRLGAGRLGRLEKALLDAVDGQRTVRDLLEETSVSSFEGSKILYQLLQSKLVRRRAT
ncbi:MAG: DUF4388 domain-containing protein, partial [Myxococcales bacterium]